MLDFQKKAIKNMQMCLLDWDSKLQELVSSF